MSKKKSFFILSVIFLLLASAAFANGDGKKKLTVKVKFNDGVNLWGTPQERTDFINNLKTQLQSEWGNDVKVERHGKEETIKGLDVDVSEGDAGPDDLAVIVHATNDNGGKPNRFGRYPYRSRECHVYPKNMKDTDWSADPNVAAWLEKTAAHEVGHYACADDKNIDANDNSPQPDKMAQSGFLKRWADNQNPKQTFDQANAGRKFSDDLRQKQMDNLNKGGPQCATDADFFDVPYYGNSTLVVEDPVGEEEEEGIVNFAITVSGPNAGDFDLGFVNAGPDGVPDTNDDYVLTKWLGDNEMEFDWTPYDGNDDWEHFGPEPLDNVVSLFDTAWYSWAAIDISTGSEFLLQDFGTLSLLDPAFNDIWGITVYRTVVLDFDFNLDSLVDLSFTLSSDLSGLMQNGELLYALNNPGTGVVIEPIPEPECYPACLPNYQQWVAVNKPDCWCYHPRQCHGDADNVAEGSTKTGYYYVHFNDLALLQSGWNIKEPPKGPGIAWPNPCICADFAHDQEGSTKTGYYRVHFNDLAILLANWNIKEPPKGPGIEPNCLDCP